MQEKRGAEIRKSSHLFQGQFQYYYYPIIFHKIIKQEGFLIFHSIHTHASWKETENQKKGKTTFDLEPRKAVHQPLVYL